MNRPFWLLFLFVYASLVTHALAGDDNLRITFTTTNPGGKYKNKHVHAVWLTTPSGQFVTTVGNDAVNKRAVWAKKRAKSLKGWWNNNPDRNADIVARTGATVTAYRTYQLNWNWRDRNGSLIPDGDYRLHFECTNADSGSPRNYASFNITKGREPWTLGPLTQGGYQQVQLTYSIAGLSLSHLPPHDVTEKTATVQGSLSGTKQIPHRVTLYWGFHDGGTTPAQWDYRIVLNNRQDGPFTATLTGLTPHTTYYYRCQVHGPTESLWVAATDTFIAEANPVLCPVGSIWSYFEGTRHPGSNWTQVNLRTDSRSGWKQGPSGIGYSDGDDNTEIDMRNRYITLFMRYPFTLGSLADVTSMIFTVDYDDGFVAYLNGTEVARRGVPVGHNLDTPAQNHSAAVEGGQVETIDLSPYIPHLQTGPNILAIEVHNASLNSSDLTMIPTLSIHGLQSNQPDLNITPQQLDFGPQTIGKTTEQTLTLTNRGELPLILQTINLVGLTPEGFSIETSPLLQTIASGKTTDITIRFTPTQARTYTYTQCIIGTNDWDQPLWTIPLTGIGIDEP